MPRNDTRWEQLQRTQAEIAAMPKPDIHDDVALLTYAEELLALCAKVAIIVQHLDEDDSTTAG